MQFSNFKNSTVFIVVFFLLNYTLGNYEIDSTTRKVADTSKKTMQIVPLTKPTEKSWVFLNFGASYIQNYSDIALKYPDYTSFPIAVEYQHQGKWVGSAEFNIYFGTNVKTTGFFDNISNENGDIIDIKGHPAIIRPRMRGFGSRVYVSRNIYPFKNQTKKTLALQIGIGGGYTQTYIEYQVDQGTVLQIEGNNVTGYDKLASGYQIAERLRIQYFNFNAISCVLGVDFIQGVSYSQRPWDFGNNKSDTDPIKEIAMGVHFGLIIPIRINQKLRDQEYFTD